MQAPWSWSKTETCRSDIYVYFNINFNVFFKFIKVHLLVSELQIYQNARCNDRKKLFLPRFPPVDKNLITHLFPFGAESSHAECVAVLQQWKETDEIGEAPPVYFYISLYISVLPTYDKLKMCLMCVYIYIYIYIYFITCAHFPFYFLYYVSTCNCLPIKEPLLFVPHLRFTWGSSKIKQAHIGNTSVSCVLYYVTHVE